MSDLAVADPSPSLDTAMDSFFDAGAPPDPGADAGAPPAPDGGAPPDPGADPAPEGADLDPNADPNAADPNAVDPNVPDPNAADLPEGASLDGKHIRIDAPRFNNIYRDYKFAQELRGIVPDVKTAQEMYGRATDLRHMHADFASGDPTSIDQFLSYWEEQSPDGFAAMAARAFERAPEAVRSQISQQAVSAFFDDLYAKAEASGDAQDLYRARQAEFHATGDWRKTNAPKVDPLAAREKSIADRENQFKQQQQQQAAQATKNWTNQTFATIGTEVMADIDRILAPIKDRFAATPKIFDTLRRDIKTQAIQTAEADGEWRRNFNLDLKAAQRTMSPGDRTALAQQYKSRVGRILAGIAAPLVKEATALQVQQNQGAHDRLAASSARRGGAAPGAPVRTSVTNGQRDRSQMTLDEKIDLDMAA